MSDLKLRKSKSVKLPEELVVPGKSKREKTAEPRRERVRKSAVQEVKQEVKVESEPVFEVPTTDTTSRRLGKEDIGNQFDNILGLLDNELNLIKGDKQYKVSGKLLRTLGTELRRIKTNSLKLMKKPKKKTDGLQSGFMKPVQISREMATFAGWNLDEPRSRVDVTKFICDYVKRNNLQNPADRRQILVDKKLGALLRYDPSVEPAPLTYYLLQSRIQHHFV